MKNEILPPKHRNLIHARFTRTRPSWLPSNNSVVLTFTLHALQAHDADAQTLACVRAQRTLCGTGPVDGPQKCSQE